MARMAWKLKREGGGAKAEGFVGIRIILSFSFFSLSATEIIPAINCVTTGTWTLA